MDDDDAKRKKSKMWVERKENCCRRRRRAYIYTYNNTAYNSNRISFGGNEKFLYIFCMYTYWNVLRLTHFNMNLK